jgi:hypothetical protein
MWDSRLWRVCKGEEHAFEVSLAGFNGKFPTAP